MPPIESKSGFGFNKVKEFNLDRQKTCGDGAVRSATNILPNSSLTGTDSDLRAALVREGLRETIDLLKPEYKERALTALRSGNFHKTKVAIQKAFEKQRAETVTKRAETVAELTMLERDLAALEELTSWCAAKPVFSSAAVSRFLDCSAAFKKGDLISLRQDHLLPEEAAEFLRNECVIYLIEHQWSSIVGNVSETAVAEYRLPHDRSCFEFVISGHRVCVGIHAEDGTPMLMFPMVKSKVGWVCDNVFSFSGGKWCARDDGNFLTPMIEVIVDQIKAICICLDAEVVASVPMRMPHLSNTTVEQATIPLYSFKSLSLIRRQRLAPVTLSESPQRKIRLHFRRGHWRHFQRHKTWIKWMLVGNPDLGFVDKEYRL